MRRRNKKREEQPAAEPKPRGKGCCSACSRACCCGRVCCCCRWWCANVRRFVLVSVVGIIALVWAAEIVDIGALQEANSALRTAKKQLGKGDGVLFNYESERAFKMSLELYESSYARGTGSSLTSATVRLLRLPLIATKIQFGFEHDAGWKALRAKLRQHAKKLRESRMKKKAPVEVGADGKPLVEWKQEKDGKLARDRPATDGAGMEDEDVSALAEEVSASLLLKNMKKKLEAQEQKGG